MLSRPVLSQALGGDVPGKDTVEVFCAGGRFSQPVIGKWCSVVAVAGLLSPAGADAPLLTREGGGMLAVAASCSGRGVSSTGWERCPTVSGARAEPDVLKD